LTKETNSAQLSTDKHPESEPDLLMNPKTYIYFVGETKYETDQAVLTGRQIKERIKDYPVGYALWLDGHGSDPDRLIGDDTPVDFAATRGADHFHLAPPGNFGSR
jgi:hypothetical protein